MALAQVDNTSNSGQSTPLNQNDKTATNQKSYIVYLSSIGLTL